MTAGNLPQLETDECEIIVTGSQITVKGLPESDQVRVYDFGGRFIGSYSSQFNLPQGGYIIRVLNKTDKIIIK